MNRELSPNFDRPLPDRLLSDAVFEVTARKPNQSIAVVNTESAEKYPVRCRALVFNEVGDRLLVIRRQRPGQAPYAVLPGGGLEEDDATPLMGIQRELKEELGDSAGDITIDDSRVLELTDDSQWIYFATAPVEHLASTSIGGPEATRDESISGTYELAWIRLEDLEEENVVPTVLRTVLQEAYETR